jgi:hypothetical protein
LDRDRYELSVPKGDLLVRLDVPNFAALTRVEIQLDGQTIVVNQRSIVFTRHDLFAASTITIRGYSAADVAQPVPYQLSIATDDIDARCPMLNTANFTEAGDGADNLGNNVYEFSGSDASFTAAVDAAEATGITLSDTASYRINGVSADIPAGFDKDSYAFHTAPGISQVTVRVDWEGGRNVDLYLFKAGTLTSAGAGDEFTTQSPDYFTLLVQPDTDYVLVARCLSGSTPFDYSMTMCGGTYRVDGK